MHIPDGFIAPPTYAVGYVIMAPIWAVAAKVMRKSLSRRQVPMLALGAAFSFVVMFLSVPVMGRMTAHPVGAGLVAIVVGPWAACIGISAALLVQAIPFGDGGVTTYGLNCLNMAVIMPFVSWAVFTLLSGRKPKGTRLWVSSFAAGYLGVIAAAAAVGFEFGIQPHQDYLPYTVAQAMTAMLIPHLLIIGPIEGIITAAAVAYLYKSEPGLAPEQEANAPKRRLAIVSALILLLAPLGMLIPKWTGAGSAWGEWSADELRRMFGRVPHGIQSGGDLWRAPFPDYGLSGKYAGPLWLVAIAVAGAIATLVLGWGVARLVSRRGQDASS